MIWLALLLSMLVHELGHAVVADGCGDPTPRRAGRLSLNPFRHCSLLLTGVVPLVTYALSHGTLILGAMKPMPIAYARLTREQRIQVALTAPALNAWLAVLCWPFWPEVALLNAGLAVINLLPIPPLDGWRVVEALRA